MYFSLKEEKLWKAPNLKNWPFKEKKLYFCLKCLALIKCIYSNNRSRWSHIILRQVRMVPLNTVVQDGDDHISTGVASLPGCKDIHFWTAAAVFITTVLENSESHQHQHEHAFTCNRFQSHAFDFENREHWKTIDMKPYSQLSRNTSLYYLSNLIMTQSICEEICHNKQAREPVN